MKHSERGFTLIEIMVVVVIIGLLASLVGPELWRLFFQSQEDIAAVQAKSYYDKVGIWMMQSKKGVPGDLSALTEPMPGEEEPLLDRLEDDPWGNKYFIVQGASARKYRVVSAGPDAVEGTEDDIGYPPLDDE